MNLASTSNKFRLSNYKTKRYTLGSRYLSYSLSASNDGRITISILTVYEITSGSGPNIRLYSLSITYYGRFTKRFVISLDE